MVLVESVVEIEYNDVFPFAELSVDVGYGDLYRWDFFM